MKLSQLQKTEPLIEDYDSNYISTITTESFTKIAPFWPLKNLIAVNPLQGLEDLPIEEALKAGVAYFEQKMLPEPMQVVNRETIKWLQAYFDDGQATIPMPLRRQGLYSAWRQLALYDAKLHHNDKQKQRWIRGLPKTAEQAMAECLLRLSVVKEEHSQFLTLLLTTLPGWAAYVKYRTEWAGLDAAHPHPVSQVDYLAMRLIMTCLLWPEARILTDWHKKAIKQSGNSTNPLEQIQKAESSYRLPLLKKLAAQPMQQSLTPEAQIVFCIDTRSEPFRRALESTGNYQTFGFAGFFGIPVQVTNSVTSESYASCPVLLSPKHEVRESSCSSHGCDEENRKGYERLTGLKRLYQSVKYTFTTPFALVEGLGILSGIWMALRSLAPEIASKLKTTVIQTISKPQEVQPLLDTFTLTEQCAYAESALQTMGLTRHFAPLVVLCGHGSATQNNAYATALDCGACGGRHGGSNARILAAILNRSEVRDQLYKNGIRIPETTRFIAAQHNTTTDEITIYGHHDTEEIKKLKKNFEKARDANSLVRFHRMERKSQISNAVSHTWRRSQDWAQVRPEWGLARNAAFIVAPRDITSSLNLEGRCFLHSYDYTQDAEGSSLAVILTAPMVVAQWINMQYLFSTVNNVAYGGGSKITKNITGKIGIMQGNASDLMTGLPLQSVYISDTEPYHEPQRLMTVVFAPRQMLDNLMSAQPILQKLFGNGWVQLACIEPDKREIYLLNRDFTWQKMN